MKADVCKEFLTHPQVIEAAQSDLLSDEEYAYISMF